MNWSIISAEIPAFAATAEINFSISLRFLLSTAAWLLIDSIHSLEEENLFPVKRATAVRADEKFPTAAFDILFVKEISNGKYYLEGNLTIKDITHLTGFETEVESTNNALSLTGKLIIDRTQYDIKFRSGNFFKDLGDTLIYNDFDLDFIITAEVAKN